MCAYFNLHLFPPYDQCLTDVLNRGGTQLAANSIQDGIALGSIFAIDPYFDQLVGLKRVVDLLEHGRRQTIAGDTHHGVQVVGLRAKGSPLCGREFSHIPTH